MEGTSNSLDLPIYDALFQDISVVPQESCRSVQQAVKGIRETYSQHDLEAFGLIDADGRPEEQIKVLAESGVFALSVYSAEALYYCHEAVEAVARRQAESFGGDPTVMAAEAKRNALKLLEEDRLAKRMAARRSEARIRDLVLSRIPDWKTIETSEDTEIALRTDSPYPEELEHFKKLVKEGDLNGLVARYPLRHSRVLSAIAKALKCGGREDYECLIVSQVRRDDNLARALRKRVGPLASVLATSPTDSEDS